MYIHIHIYTYIHTYRLHNKAQAGLDLNALHFYFNE